MAQACNLLLKSGGGATGTLRSLSDNDIATIKNNIALVDAMSERLAAYEKDVAEAKAAIGPTLPIGSIVAWMLEEIPSKFLLCAGQTITSTEYPDLVATITGSDTATEAVIPNLQGVFLRGYGSCEVTQNNGTAVGTTVTTHTSGALGEVQGDAMRQLYGTLPVGGTTTMGNNVNAALSGTFSYSKSVQSAGFASALSKTAAQAFFDSSRTTPTATEFRPVNVAVNYIIRAL